MFPFTINGDVRIVGADTSLIRNTIIVRTVDSGLPGKGNSQMKNYELIHLLQQLPYNYDVVVQYRDDGGYYYGTDSNIVPTADDEKKIIVL